MFSEYLGKDKLTASIIDQRGRRRRCSVANLTPIHTPPGAAGEINIEEQPISGDALQDEEAESDTSGSDIPSPIGVRVNKRARTWDADFWPSDEEQ